MTYKEYTNNLSLPKRMDNLWELSLVLMKILNHPKTEHDIRVILNCWIDESLKRNNAEFKDVWERNGFKQNIDYLEEWDPMIERKNLIEMEDIKFYHGIFTGKQVKLNPETNDIHFKKFSKDEDMIVFNYKDFMKFIKDLRIGTKE